MRQLFGPAPLLRHSALLIALLLVSFGCKTTSEVPLPEAKYLVSGTQIGANITKAELISRATANLPPAAIPLVQGLAQFDIRAYKIVYNTTGEDGKAIQASGVVLAPVADRPLPLLSYQHGTIREQDETRAPSYYQPNGEVYSLISLLASNGYVVAAPDYVGYGASQALPHPYEHAATLASASLDMLRAAREFCQRNNVALNQKLFLTGYSEGGFATMALHKLIEEKHAAEFPITASAPGAGAYHKSAFARFITTSGDNTLRFINTYAWVLTTYDRVYKLNRPYNTYFNAPFDVALRADVWDETVSRVPNRLFTQSFRDGIVGGTDVGLRNALRDNDVHDWKPIAPVTLFHGTADDYVPFFNSQDAFDAMRARGATNVRLTPLQGTDHFSSAPGFILGVLDFFSTFK